MIDQPSSRPFEASPFFADGRAMRAPPAGTIARDRVLGKPALLEGMVEGAYVTECRCRSAGACSPAGAIASSCSARPATASPATASPRWRTTWSCAGLPRWWTSARRAFPPGRVFHVITVGYGLMRSYATSCRRTIAGRWWPTGRCWPAASGCASPPCARAARRGGAGAAMRPPFAPDRRPEARPFHGGRALPVALGAGAVGAALFLSACSSIPRRRCSRT